MTEVSNWVTLMEGSGQQQNLGTSLWFRCAGQGKLVDRNSLVKIDEEFLLVIGHGAAKGSTRAFYSFGWVFFFNYFKSSEFLWWLYVALKNLDKLAICF